VKKINKYKYFSLLLITTLIGSILFLAAPVKSATSSIVLANPKPYQILQRKDNNTADIAVRGTYTGDPGAIQARWRGGEWVVIDNSPHGGHFFGILTNQKAGQGTLEVRFTSNTSVKTEARFIGIGDVYVLAGGSNASGRGLNNQRYVSKNFKAAIFANDYKWKDMKDPIDSCKNQKDMVSCDKNAGGSAWPLLATRLMASHKVPVAFIPVAKGGTIITQWQKDANPNGLYNTMVKRVSVANIGGVKTVILQGANGAAKNISANDFENSTNKFASDVKKDMGANTALAEIGDYSKNWGTGSVNRLRESAQRLWEQNGNVKIGPVLYDVNLRDEKGDGLHYMTNQELTVLANRWWMALLHANSGYQKGRGPVLQQATLGKSKKTIILTFKSKSLPLIPSSNIRGFTARDEAGKINIVSTNVKNKNQVFIELSRKAKKGLVVSYASGRSALGTRALRDSSPRKLPAEVFYNYVVN